MECRAFFRNRNHRANRTLHIDAAFVFFRNHRDASLAQRQAFDANFDFDFCHNNRFFDFACVARFYFDCNRSQFSAHSNHDGTRKRNRFARHSGFASDDFSVFGIQRARQRHVPFADVPLRNGGRRGLLHSPVELKADAFFAGLRKRIVLQYFNGVRGIFQHGIFFLDVRLDGAIQKHNKKRNFFAAHRNAFCRIYCSRRTDLSAHNKTHLQERKAAENFVRFNRAVFGRVFFGRHESRAFIGNSNGK